MSDTPEGRESVEEQIDRQEGEGLEHPAPGSVEDEGEDAMEGPAPSG
jgi:hypothetical protein